METVLDVKEKLNLVPTDISENTLNEIGEFLRDWSFVGEGTGCYANFDLREGFNEVPKESHLVKELTSKLGYNESYYQEESFFPAIYLYYHAESDLYVAWYWDGDGTLLIGSGNVWVRNDDCKTDYTWERVA